MSDESWKFLGTIATLTEDLDKTETGPNNHALFILGRHYVLINK